MLEVALTDGSGAEDKGAVGYGFGDGGRGDGCGEHLGGIDRRFRRFERYGKVVDDAEVAKAEVVHRAGHGSNIGRVTGADENDADAGSIE